MTPEFKYQISDSELALTPSAKVKFAEVWKDVKDENIEAVQNLRFQKALQQLEDGTSISKIKKEIAQIKTVLNEFNLGIRDRKGKEESE